MSAGSPYLTLSCLDKLFIELSIPLVWTSKGQRRSRMSPFLWILPASIGHSIEDGRGTVN